MTAIERYAEFAASPAPPREAVDAAKMVVLDWLGAAIVGADEMPASGLRSALPCDGAARLIPDGTADPRTAALINAAASHTVEVDDIFREGLYHPGVVTIPAALALSDAEDASGARFLNAVIAGYEVSNRIAGAVNPAHYRFWHTTATVGHFGAAVAGAVALGLKADGIAHAMATAGTFAAGLRQAFASDAMSKPLHAGRAAEGGVLAALAARTGITGVLDILDAPRGFGAAMSDAVDWDRATEGLGATWTITKTTQKAHACCGHNFAALDAIRILMDQHALTTDDIAGVEVRTYRAALDICGNPDPVSAAEGRFSLPWCAALMIARGTVAPDGFSADALGDENLRALASAVTLTLDPGAEERFPNARSATVVLTLRDGRKLEHHRPTRKGDPDDPMTVPEIAHKFRTLASPVVGQGAADDMIHTIAHIHEMKSIRDLPFKRNRF